MILITNSIVLGHILIPNSIMLGDSKCLSAEWCSSDCFERGNCEIPPEESTLDPNGLNNYFPVVTFPFLGKVFGLLVAVWTGPSYFRTRTIQSHKEISVLNHKHESSLKFTQIHLSEASSSHG